MKKLLLLLLILTSCSKGIIKTDYLKQIENSNIKGIELREPIKRNTYNRKFKLLGYRKARIKLYNFIYNKNNSLTGVYSGYKRKLKYGGKESNPDPINCEHIQYHNLGSRKRTL